MVFNLLSFLKSCSDNTCFWTSDFKLLLSTHIIPSVSKSYIYNLNVASRILIILMIIGFVINVKMFLICLIGLILCYIIYRILKYIKDNKKENFRVFDRAFNTIKDVDDDNNLINRNTKKRKKINYNNLKFDYNDLKDFKNLDFEDRYNNRVFKFYNDR